MAGLDPNEREEDEVGDLEGVVEVVEEFGGLGLGYSLASLDFLPLSVRLKRMMSIDIWQPQRTEIKRQTHSKKEITPIMRHKHQQTKIRKMEPPTQRDQPHRNEMMYHQFLEIPSRDLQPQDQHKHLLGPEARLEEVVRFEEERVREVWIVLIHDPGVQAHVHDGGR